MSFENPSRQVTNSDLKLAAAVLQNDIAAHQHGAQEHTISSGSNNTPAVAWQAKGSTTAASAPAHLLRLQTLHQRFHRYFHSAFYVPGAVNIMADEASRLFQLSDASLLTHLNTVHPQMNSWRLVHPRIEMLSSFVACTFTTQKSCVRNKVIGFGFSGNPFCCPVTSTATHIKHRREHLAPPTASLCTHCRDGSPSYVTASDIPSYVTASDITTALKASVEAPGPQLGFLPSKVSARSLCAAGAMAPLCAHVDTDTIRLLGRWQSDVMLQHLTVQAQPVMRDFSRHMLEGGADYLLLPNQEVWPH
jgi:hypothetical protein